MGQVGQHVQDVAFGHALQQGGFQRPGRCRGLTAQTASDHWLAPVVDNDVAARRQRSVHLLGGRRQQLLKVLDEACGRGRQFDRLAVVRHLGPGQGLLSIFGIPIRVLNGDIASLEGRGKSSEGT